MDMAATTTANIIRKEMRFQMCEGNVLCKRKDCAHYSTKEMPSWADCGECTKSFITVNESGCEGYLKIYTNTEAKCTTESEDAE